MCVCTGGEGKTGKVVDVLDWSNEGGSVYEVSVCRETFTRVLNIHTYMTKKNHVVPREKRQSSGQLLRAY